MADLGAQTDDVHIIREVHLRYGRDKPVLAPLTDTEKQDLCRDFKEMKDDRS